MRIPRPPTLRRALGLMGLAAALTFLQTVVACAVASGGKDGQVAYVINGGFFVSSDGGQIPGSLVAGLLVFGLVSAALLIWMLWICRLGRNWGRVVSSVFFGLGVFSLSNNFRPGVPLLDALLSFVIMGIGLVALILLWHRQSELYFKPWKVTLPPRYQPPNVY